MSTTSARDLITKTTPDVIKTTALYIHTFTGSNLINFIAPLVSNIRTGTLITNNIIKLFESDDENIFEKNFTLYYVHIYKFVVGTSSENDVIILYPYNIIYCRSDDVCFLGNIIDFNQINSHIVFDRIYPDDKKHYIGLNAPMPQDSLDRYHITYQISFSPLFMCNYTLELSNLHNIFVTFTDIYRSLFSRQDVIDSLP
jgi:hypothetical protein